MVCSVRCASQDVTLLHPSGFDRPSQVCWRACSLWCTACSSCLATFKAANSKARHQHRQKLVSVHNGLSKNKFTATPLSADLGFAQSRGISADVGSRSLRGFLDVPSRDFALNSDSARMCMDNQKRGFGYHGRKEFVQLGRGTRGTPGSPAAREEPGEPWSHPGSRGALSPYNCSRTTPHPACLQTPLLGVSDAAEPTDLGGALPATAAGAGQPCADARGVQAGPGRTVPEMRTHLLLQGPRPATPQGAGQRLKVHLSLHQPAANRRVGSLGTQRGHLGTGRRSPLWGS